jgi:lipopolysaccharide transport system permease protein
MRSLNDELVISANSRRSVDIRELWLYRELFYFFAWRDIKVRYKQTALGASWAVLQPFLATGVFTLFFNRVAHIGSGSADIPYPVFAYLGLAYWNAFSGAINTVSNSLVANQGVLTKIYFPRLIPPMSATLLSIVDFFFAIVIFFILLLVYRVPIRLEGILCVIPALVLIIAASLSMGIFFAALNVKYRDVRSALPFLLQILMFMTPVIYPVNLIPQRFQIYTYLNPAAGAINNVRAGIFHTAFNWPGLALSIASTVVMLCISLWYFKRTEKNFADII